MLWLLYLVSALVAFLNVRKLDWRIVPWMLVGAAATVLGWGLLYLLTSEELRSPFWRVDLSLNASFALIFAAVGAAIAFAMKSRNAG